MATNNSINTGKPIEVIHGGTQNSSFTAYSVVCGGTTSANPLQTVASNGTAGQVLISQGSAALPVWTGGSGAWQLVQTIDASNSSSVSFTSGITSTYDTYRIVVSNITESAPGTSPNTLIVRFSNNGGVSYFTSGYVAGVTWSAISLGISWNNNNRSDGIPIIDTVTAITQPHFFTCTFFNLTNGGYPTMIIPGTGLTQSGRTYFGTGYYATPTVVDAISFSMLPPTENIFTGRFSLYGLSK